MSGSSQDEFTLAQAEASRAASWAKRNRTEVRSEGRADHGQGAVQPKEAQELC